MTLAQVRRLALALPEAAEAPHFDYASFRVRKKIFATAPPDGMHLHVFVDELAHKLLRRAWADKAPRTLLKEAA